MGVHFDCDKWSIVGYKNIFFIKMISSIRSLNFIKIFSIKPISEWKELLDLRVRWINVIPRPYDR